MLKDLNAAELLRSFTGFVTEGCGVVLNKRQLEAAGVILKSVCRREGSSFNLSFSCVDQQVLQNHLLVYLLRMYNHAGYNLLVIHPDPCRQVKAMDRLVESLWANIFTRERWSRQGDDFTIGNCRARFCHVGEVVLPGVAAPHLLVLINQLHDIPNEMLPAPISRVLAVGNPTRVVCGVESISVVENKNLAFLPTSID